MLVDCSSRERGVTNLTKPLVFIVACAGNSADYCWRLTHRAGLGLEPATSARRSAVVSQRQGRLVAFLLPAAS